MTFWQTGEPQHVYRKGTKIEQNDVFEFLQGFFSQRHLQTCSLPSSERFSFSVFTVKLLLKNPLLKSLLKAQLKMD